MIERWLHSFRWQHGGYLWVSWVLLLLGGLLTALTGQGQVRHLQALLRHGGGVVNLGRQARPSPSLDSRMVRVVGTPQVIQPAVDAQFGQSVKTTRLIRDVAMFQWQQVHGDNGPEYQLQWHNGRVNSAHFAQPRGHRNPPLLVSTASFFAPQVRLDGFLLAPALLKAIIGEVPVQPDIRGLPENLKASFRLVGNTLATVLRHRPSLGDIRVSWRSTPLQTITIFAKVQGGQLVPAVNAAAGHGFIVQLGDQSLSNLLPDVPDGPTYPMGRLGLAWFLIALGVAGWWRGRADPARRVVVAVIAGAGLTGLILGLYWVTTRFYLGGGLLLSGLILVGAAWWVGSRKSSTG